MSPAGHLPEPAFNPSWADDLALDNMARAFEAGTRYTSFIRAALAGLPADPATIAWRQAVLNDFLRNPELAQAVTGILPRLADLRLGHALLGRKQRGLLMETIDRISELDLLLTVVLDLHAALNAADLTSDALRALRISLSNIIRDDDFQALRAELPELQAPLQHVASLTIGINLDEQFQPVSAALLRINDRPVGEARTFLGRLLGVRTEQDGDDGAIAPLHFTPPERELRPLSPFFQDLDRLISQVASAVARGLTRYVRVSSQPLSGLENELAFFASAADLIRQLEARGIPFCQPEIAPLDARVIDIEALVNLNLAIRAPDSPPIPSDVCLDDEGRIAILTGPNSGGKTTYVQAVGLAQVLFQAGLFVPAKRARLSPVDTIYTHFPAPENMQGRLAEEASRLRHICLSATRNSLVLLNESLASTTAGEALYLAQDVVAGLRAIGVRALYATHLVELAERRDEIEAAAEGDSRVYGLIADIQFVDDPESGERRPLPTFHIRRGVSQGRGYAHEIARRYGISLEQILQARKDDTGAQGQ
jgi:hypothetical protein